MCLLAILIPYMTRRLTVAWALLAHDEKSGEEWWELDMTGGRVPEIEKNAQMSRDAKELMVWMHTKG